MDCNTEGFPIVYYLLEFAQIHVHWISDAIQPSRPLLSPSPPAFSLSQHQGLFCESALHNRWPKYWSFSFSISPSNEYSGLISFRIDWFDLAVQGTLKSLLQHSSSKASILWCSAFFYDPTLISVHDYWKNHSFDSVDLCWQSDVSAFFFFFAFFFPQLFVMPWTIAHYAPLWDFPAKNTGVGCHSLLQGCLCFLICCLGLS